MSGIYFPLCPSILSTPGAFGKPIFAVFESDALEVLSVRVKLVVD